MGLKSPVAAVRVWATETLLMTRSKVMRLVSVLALKAFWVSCPTTLAIQASLTARMVTPP